MLRLKVQHSSFLTEMDPFHIPYNNKWYPFHITIFTSLHLRTDILQKTVVVCPCIMLASVFANFCDMFTLLNRFQRSLCAWAGFFKAGREKSQVTSRVRQGEKRTSSRLAFKKPNNNLLQVRIFCRT